MSSMRKRNFEDALDSSQGQEDEGRTCKATKVDAEDSELPQDEHNPAIVKSPTLRLHSVLDGLSTNRFLEAHRSIP